MGKVNLCVTGKVVVMRPGGHRFRLWKQEMQGKIAYNRPLMPNSSPDPMHKGSLCTGLPLLDLNWE